MSVAIFARDDLVKLMFRLDFFKSNPDLADLQELIERCRANWEASIANSSCRCGGSPKTVFECLDALLARLDALRTLDEDGADVIVVERPPPLEAWLAVGDRLQRAAAERPRPRQVAPPADVDRSP